LFSSYLEVGGYGTLVGERGGREGGRKGDVL